VKDQPPREDGDGAQGRSEEVWIVASNPELKIRVRSLTLYLQHGGSLKDIRLVEGEDGAWTIWVRLASRPGEYRVNRFNSDRPKTYRDVALAVACCREDFGYFGAITLSTDKLAGGPTGQAAIAADHNVNGDIIE